MYSKYCAKLTIIIFPQFLSIVLQKLLLKFSQLFTFLQTEMWEKYFTAEKQISFKSYQIQHFGQTNLHKCKATLISLQNILHKGLDAVISLV